MNKLIKSTRFNLIRNYATEWMRFIRKRSENKVIAVAENIVSHRVHRGINERVVNVIKSGIRS